MALVFPSPRLGIKLNPKEKYHFEQGTGLQSSSRFKGTLTVVPFIPPPVFPLPFAEVEDAAWDGQRARGARRHCLAHPLGIH